MAKVVKVIELMSQSPKSWEDAVQGAERGRKPCGISDRFMSRNLLLKWMMAKSQTIASTRRSLLIWNAAELGHRYSRFAVLCEAPCVRGNG